MRKGEPYFCSPFTLEHEVKWGNTTLLSKHEQTGRFIKETISIFVFRWIQLQNKSAIWENHGYSRLNTRSKTWKVLRLAWAESDCSPGLPWKLKIQQERQLDPLLRKPQRLATTITMVTEMRAHRAFYPTSILRSKMLLWSWYPHFSQIPRNQNSELGMLVSWKESSRGFWWTQN